SRRTAGIAGSALTQGRAIKRAEPPTAPRWVSLRSTPSCAPARLTSSCAIFPSGQKKRHDLSRAVFEDFLNLTTDQTNSTDSPAQTPPWPLPAWFAATSAVRLLQIDPFHEWPTGSTHS